MKNRGRRNQCLSENLMLEKGVLKDELFRTSRANVVLVRKLKTVRNSAAKATEYIETLWEHWGSRRRRQQGVRTNVRMRTVYARRNKFRDLKRRQKQSMWEFSMNAEKWSKRVLPQLDDNLSGRHSKFYHNIGRVESRPS
ncbi:hypothetical protein B9Z55_026325 [Caenorhabditis nigoni]|uniref:Uncharacterized protein n=1 Tax=Caenorhabditis nigoni TaxID=1611254 RepID=A0A2G5T292_9PELO|nr:hypothetical protein B9Z55_026325 [Caenorhabditis nigoni]